MEKPEILNKAILASSSDYLICIDGDCILHSHFIEEHFNKKSGVALEGWRYSGLLSIVFCETFLLVLLFFQVFNPILSYLCLASILFGFIAAILVYIFLRSHSGTVRIIVIISLACVNIGISWIIEAITRFYHPSRSINEFRNLAMFLTRAYNDGKIIIPDTNEDLQNLVMFEYFLNDLASEEWVSYCKPPFASPEQVVKYIGRYTASGGVVQ